MTDNAQHYPLHVQISSLFIALILLVSSVLATLGYRLGADLLEENARDASLRISREMVGEIRLLLAPGENATRLLGHSSLAYSRTHEARMGRVAELCEALIGSEALSSIYMGYPDGDFFFMRRLSNASEQAYFDAPEGTRFMVQSIDRDDTSARGRFVFLDDDLNILRLDDKPAYASGFDPRDRAWYQAASSASGQIQTAPYMFFSNRKLGTTIAVTASATGVVVGADILLSTLAESLIRNKITPRTEVFVVDAGGRLFAHEELGEMIAHAQAPQEMIALPLLSDIPRPLFRHLAANLITSPGMAPESLVPLADEVWRISVQRLAISGAEPMHLVVAIPERELLADAHAMMRTAMLLTLVVIVAAIPISWMLARSVSRPLRILAQVAERIRNFDFDHSIGVRSMVKEVAELALTLDAMKRTIRRFLDVSVAVASEPDFDRLMKRLLDETVSAAEARAGMLYLCDEGRFALGAEWMPDDLPRVLDPVLDTVRLSVRLKAAMTAAEPQSLDLHPVDLSELGFSADQFDAQAIRLVVVPLRNRRNEQVGAMLLLREGDVDAGRLSYIDAVCGASVVSLENKALIRAQKALFEAFIKLIAGAIDAKSPYTGGHCARVPELTKMLAQAACADAEGRFAAFKLSDEEWEAVHVAAWLHDCGKVTTPEFVVDKSTKLESLYDRIHEVRMRFEVLKCDAEIDALRERLQGMAEEDVAARLSGRLSVLDQEFAFVATCNRGGECLSPEAIARLHQIAQRRWRRTLDDRIGISHEELKRKLREPAAELPVLEPLLADRAEHLFERGAQDHAAENPALGFNMKVPRLLYNRGELYNLSVGRGTLTEEERYKINEHIVQTLVMLSQLPFPKHLRAVPELAGGHHEKMDGSGYPRGLKREQMSPVARMMAIADIFEALTAVDRPYKVGKTLSEAIAIMAKMRDEQHIDAELFELFLTSGVYLDYAQRYLHPDQIDEVDVAVNLGI